MSTTSSFDGVFSGRKILVTGHTGFKGSWLSIWLDMLGAEVLGYSLDPALESKQRNFNFCRLHDRMTHLIGDIRDFESVREVVSVHRPEVVIHMAAQPLVLTGYQEPRRTYDTNVGGTVNLLEAIREVGSARVFVGVTTDKVYENQEISRGYREDDLLGGFDPYAASKAMMEICMQSYRRSWDQEWMDGARFRCFSTENLMIASARAGNVIGGGDFAAYRLVPDCMKALLDRRAIELRNPHSVRPWQFVLEPLAGYLWLAAKMLRQTDSNFCEAWNFGPREDDAVSCETLAKKSIGLWGEGEFQATPSETAKGHETSVLRLNWDKAASLLDWSPAYSWEEGLGATVEWFREYQNQGGSPDDAPDSVDMLEFCRGQIATYVESARQHGIRWASPAA
jgi:CDP-glucose 4,6-dehydratase